MDRKEFYNSLSDDVKKQLKECKTDEEMLKVLGDNKIPLDEELLKGVAGGGPHHCPRNCSDC